jgi:hypothetical protein
MSIDFLTGFESGIFMRNNTKQFDEYGCPKAKADMVEIQTMKYAIQPMKDLTKMLNNGKQITEIEDIIDTIELFVDSFDTFIAVFD